MPAHLCYPTPPRTSRNGACRYDHSTLPPVHTSGLQSTSNTICHDCNAHQPPLAYPQPPPRLWADNETIAGERKIANGATLANARLRDEEKPPPLSRHTNVQYTLTGDVHNRSSHNPSYPHIGTLRHSSNIRRAANSTPPYREAWGGFRLSSALIDDKDKPLHTASPLVGM